jgi:hypothetical protein
MTSFLELAGDLLQYICSHLEELCPGERSAARLSGKALRDAVDSSTRTLKLDRRRHPRPACGSLVLARLRALTSLEVVYDLHPLGLDPAAVSALSGLTRFQARSAADSACHQPDMQGSLGAASDVQLALLLPA